MLYSLELVMGDVTIIVKKMDDAWKDVQYDRLDELEKKHCHINDLTCNPDNHIHTLLMCAAAHGSIKCAEYLINGGAIVNLKNFAGYTALHWAAYTGRTETLDLLISKSADVEARTEDGKTPLHIAALRGHLDFIKQLLIAKDVEGNNIDIDSVACNGWNALFFAIKSNQRAVAKYLMEQGIDYESPDCENKTVDDYAEKYKRKWYSELKKEIERKKNINE